MIYFSIKTLMTPSRYTPLATHQRRSQRPRSHLIRLDLRNSTWLGFSSAKFELGWERLEEEGVGGELSEEGGSD